MVTNFSEKRIPLFSAALLLSCLAISLLFVLHPRLGIRDVDGYAYIMGARSLHQGNGYRSLTDEAFNHWPPGYSLVLSLFSDSIRAAILVNYFSFGVAAGTGLLSPSAVWLELASSRWFFYRAGVRVFSVARKHRACRYVDLCAIPRNNLRNLPVAEVEIAQIVISHLGLSNTG
jgi:hypothetical protein